MLELADVEKLSGLMLAGAVETGDHLLHDEFYRRLRRRVF